MKPRKGKNIKCRKCGRKFYVRPSEIKTAKFCGYKCGWEYKKTNIDRKCKECGKTYYRARSQVKWRGTNFCSNNCKYNGRMPTRNVLDTLWGQAIHLRDKEQCRHCGKFGQTNAHHIFTRSRFNTRWNLENGILLCSSCHKLSSTFSAHGTPRKFYAWIESVKGKEWLDNLERASDTIAKNIDYKMYKLYLQNEIKKYS